MTLQQLQQKLPALLAWIDGTLAAHTAQARPVADLGCKRLGFYYSAGLLTSAKAIPVAKVPMPPLASISCRRSQTGVTKRSSIPLLEGKRRSDIFSFQLAGNCSPPFHAVRRTGFFDVKTDFPTRFDGRSGKFADSVE